MELVEDTTENKNSIFNRNSTNSFSDLTKDYPKTTINSEQSCISKQISCIELNDNCSLLNCTKESSKIGTNPPTNNFSFVNPPVTNLFKTSGTERTSSSATTTFNLGSQDQDHQIPNLQSASTRLSPVKQQQRFKGIKKLAARKRIIVEEEPTEHQQSIRQIPESTKQSKANHFYFLYLYMGYLQLAFNAFLVGIVIYLMVQFFLTVKRDVDIKVGNQMNEILSEISHCSKQYLDNKCHPDTRVPAMEKACMAWEACMNRDPAVVGRAKVSAITFAEIINSFVEPISFKTMLFFVVMIAATFVFGNVVLGIARAKELKYANQQQQQPVAHILTDIQHSSPSPLLSSSLTPIQFYTHGVPSSKSH